MSTDVPEEDRIPMSQKERDVLKIMHGVLRGERTQVEAADLLRLSTRQVRRLQRKLESAGDATIVHGLRGKPSNHQPDPTLKRAAVAAYRQHYRDFGPTFACEKLLENQGLTVCPQTLRRWLIEAGLWTRQRRRALHRSRRPRRDFFGELIQMDASIHDWLEGRGEPVVLITMIDDATSYLMARFYCHATVETHMDLLGRWLQRHGRPLALYTDRHSIFEPQDKGRALVEGTTQFGRALSELEIGLIRAHSPQAKGRVERSFDTAQDRWVKELRLARANTVQAANSVLEKLLPGHNRKFSKPARQQGDVHRPLGPSHNLAAILSIQEERVVANDYTVRWKNRFYQLLKPVYPGERKGKVVIEQRLDGKLMIRFGKHYLNYREVTAEACLGGSAPKPPEFNASAADASARAKEDPGSCEEPESTGMQPTDGRSGRTPAEPYPPDGEKKDTAKGKRRPAEDHPWRKGFKSKK